MNHLTQERDKEVIQGSIYVRALRAVQLGLDLSRYNADLLTKTFQAPDNLALALFQCSKVDNHNHHLICDSDTNSKINVLIIYPDYIQIKETTWTRVNARTGTMSKICSGLETNMGVFQQTFLATSWPGVVSL